VSGRVECARVLLRLIRRFCGLSRMFLIWTLCVYL
jgi:hypothetical protein